MGTVENQVFEGLTKPTIYCRYIDDIFVKVDRGEDLEILRQRLANVSGLHFTIENSSEGALPYLDVLVKQQGQNFLTEVYTKASNSGHCLNGRSECPQIYKDSTI